MGEKIIFRGGGGGKISKLNIHPYTSVSLSFPFLSICVYSLVSFIFILLCPSLFHHFIFPCLLQVFVYLSLFITSVFYLSLFIKSVCLPFLVYYKCLYIFPCLLQVFFNKQGKIKNTSNKQGKIYNTCNKQGKIYKH